MNQRIIDRTYHNKTLDINVGDTLTIILQENPSTGYQWKLDQVNKEIISLEDSIYTPDAKSHEYIGGGGNRTFSFKSVSTGVTTIGLSLKREWEKDGTPGDRFQLSVQVE